MVDSIVIPPSFNPTTRHRESPAEEDRAPELSPVISQKQQQRRTVRIGGGAIGIEEDPLQLAFSSIFSVSLSLPPEHSKLRR